MIFEYFGLPATGKSWHLGESGLRSERGAIGHSVPLGGGLDKTKNTILGVLKNKRLFLLLILNSEKTRQRNCTPPSSICTSSPL